MDLHKADRETTTTLSSMVSLFPPIRDIPFLVIFHHFSYCHLKCWHILAWYFYPQHMSLFENF